MRLSQHRAMWLILGNVVCTFIFVLLSHTHVLIKPIPSSLGEIFTSKLVYIFPTALLTFMISKLHQHPFTGLMCTIVGTCGVIFALHGIFTTIHPEPGALILGLKMIAVSFILTIPALLVWRITDRPLYP